LNKAQANNWFHRFLEIQELFRGEQ